jgi:Endopolygalacturonase
MTISPFTPLGSIGPLTNITPFTHRDNATYLRILKEIVNYINLTLRPEMDSELARILDEFNQKVEEFNSVVTTTRAEWQELFDDFMTNVEANIGEINVDVILAAAIARGEQVIDVRDHGATGDGVTNDSPAIQAAADIAADLGRPLLIPGGQYKLMTEINLKPGVNNTRRKVINDGDVIVGANVSAFVAAGTFGTSKALTADLVPRGRTLTVDNNAWFVVGETLFITSNDVVPNAPDRLGCLRKVISLTGSTTVNIDVPYYRTMLVASSLLARKVTMHPGVEITGSGNIRSINLDNNKHLIDFTLVSDPHVELNIGPSGGPGVLYAHCDGGRGGGHIHDLRDQDTVDANGLTHFGYGWNIAGATRNVSITGTAYKCRHAFTTNTAQTVRNATDTGWEFGGEPENIFTDIVTSRCSNKAIDSHRAGWSLTHIVNDSGSYGALQVRADNVHATVYAEETYDAAVNVSSTVTVPPTLARIEVNGSGGADRLGVLLLGPAVCGTIITRGCYTGVSIQSNGNRIDSLNVSGNGSASGSGINITGSDNFFGFMAFDNCGTGIVENAGSVNNIFAGQRKFTSVGTVMALQAYNHTMTLRTGEYTVNAAAPGAVKGRIPLQDNAGNVYGQLVVYTT